LKPFVVDFKLLEKVDIILLQNEIPFETTFEVAKWAKQSGKIVIFDPAPAEGIEKDIFEYVDYLTPNEVELEELSKEFLGSFESVEKSSEALLDLGVKAVIAKLGEKGIYFRRGLKEIRIPAPKVSTVDTTAAGDVFNGAFATFLKKGEMDALRLAVKAASISVTRPGAQSSIPSLEEVLGK
jgi:ribokinase